MRFRGNESAVVTDDRRAHGVDRRVRTRGGRRNGETGKPWYRKGRLWLAAVSVVYVGWHRIFRKTPA